MRADKLPKMPDLKPELIPPEGATEVGFHPVTKQIIYEVTEIDREAMAANKVQAVDADGNEIWIKDRQTGNIIKPKLVFGEPIFKTHQFVLRRTGRGHVFKEPVAMPSEADKERKRIAERKQALMDSYFQRAAEMDMTVEEFLDYSLNPIEEAAAAEEPYPRYKDGGWWALSDGTTFRGKRAGAEKAEKAVQEQFVTEALDVSEY